jgi:hypothetical protein
MIYLLFHPGNNELFGSLPEEIRVLPEMRSLDLFSNSIGGTIPNVLTSLTNLEFFDIESNVFQGPAFVDLTGLSDLQTYRVSRNNLDGTIPQEGLADLFSLKELWIASNTIGGPIPTTMDQLQSLGKTQSVYTIFIDLIELTRTLLCQNHLSYMKMPFLVLYQMKLATWI